MNEKRHRIALEVALSINPDAFDPLQGYVTVGGYTKSVRELAYKIADAIIRMDN